MRNNADPQAVGEWMKARRRRARKRPLSEIADEIPWTRMPQYDGGESMVSITTAEYRAELEARDDPEAKHMLAKLDGQGA